MPLAGHWQENECIVWNAFTIFTLFYISVLVSIESIQAVNLITSPHRTKQYSVDPALFRLSHFNINKHIIQNNMNMEFACRWPSLMTPLSCRLPRHEQRDRPGDYPAHGRERRHLDMAALERKAARLPAHRCSPLVSRFTGETCP